MTFKIFKLAVSLIKSTINPKYFKIKYFIDLFFEKK